MHYGSNVKHISFCEVFLSIPSEHFYAIHFQDIAKQLSSSLIEI